MTGKKWFYWLGKLHGARKLQKQHQQWVMWAQESYMRGWYDGFNEVSK
jgi:hypothetical protein